MATWVGRVGATVITGTKAAVLKRVKAKVLRETKRTGKQVKGTVEVLPSDLRYRRLGAADYRRMGR